MNKIKCIYEWLKANDYGLTFITIGEIPIAMHTYRAIKAEEKEHKLYCYSVCEVCGKEEIEILNNTAHNRSYCLTLFGEIKKK